MKEKIFQTYLVLYGNKFRYTYQINFYWLVHFKMLFHLRFYHKTSFVLRKVNNTFIFCLSIYFLFIWIFYSLFCIILISMYPILNSHYGIHLFIFSQILPNPDLAKLKLSLGLVGCILTWSNNNSNMLYKHSS